MSKNLKTEHIYYTFSVLSCVGKRGLIAVLWAVFGFIPSFLHGQVVVTPPSAVSLCVGGDYVNVGNIVITETNPNDIVDNGTGFTYILSLPSADYEFEDNIGTIAITGGNRLSAISMDVDPGSITVTFDHSPGGTSDEFTISNLRIRAVSFGLAGELRRTGGTSTQNGNQPSDNQNHLSLSTFITSLTVDAGGPQAICDGASVNIGGSPTASGGTGPYTYVWSPTTDLDDFTDPNPDAIPTTTTIYKAIVSDATGCTLSDNMTLTVNPIPAITNPSVDLFTTICSGEALNFIPNSSVGGTTYSWTSSTIGTISGASVTGSGTGAIMDIPINTGNSPGTVTYTITPTAGGCSGTQVDYVVTVDPLPDATASDQTLCSGATSNVLISNPNGVTGTTFSWVVHSSTNVSGATGGSGSLIGQTLTSSDMINSGSVTYRITPTANGCSGTPFDVTVTVNPTPDITNTPASLSTTICSGEVLNFIPNASVGVTTYSWISSTIGTISGASVTGSGTGTITDIPINTGNTPGTVTYTITPVFGGCSGTSVDYVVTVDPLPDATASDETICSGATSNVLISNPNGVTGTTFSWVVHSSTNVSGATGGSGSLIGQTLTGSDMINSGSVTYRITPTANGCSGSPFDVTVTVNPTPDITNTPASLSTTICSGEALNFIPNSSVGGTTYSWTSSTSGTISGASVTGSGTGAIMDTPINTGSVSGTVTYTITPTASGCSGTPVNYVVTVDPLPDATASDATICSGATSNVLISNPNGVTGTTFSWVVQSSTNVSGATGGSGSLIGQTLTSSDMINSGSVTYRITPTANGCSGSPFDVTVTVNPTPDITNTPASLSTTICSGEALNFIPNSSVGGTTYSWTSSTSGTISGASVTGSGTGTITDIPINTGNTPGTVTYTITPVFGGCSGTSVDYVVTVDPLPDATASDETICSGATSNVLISNPNGVTGTTFSWVVHSSTNVSGATGGSGSLISQTLTSSDMINSGSVTYRITPTANGCSGTPFDVTVTVNPTPDITNTPASLSTTICSGAALNFIPNSSVGGTTYSWTSSIIGTVSGASVTASGTGTIADTPINTGNAPGTVTYTITPTFGGCSGTPVDYVVTVDPLPDAMASDETICSGATSNVLISNPNGVTGTTFSWVVQSNTNVSGATGGSGSLIGQTLTSSDMINSGSVTYRITPTANGCSGTPFDVTVTVNPIPDITNTPASLSTTICSGEALNFITHSSVGSTTYSWTSSTIGTISGASVTASGTGTITNTPINTGNSPGTVTYTITPTASGCSGTPVNYVVTVDPLPDAMASDATICSGATSNVLISNPNGVTGTTFSWVVQSSTNVSGATGGSGSLIGQTLTSSDMINSGSVTYRITPIANGCSGTPFDVTVTVNPTPVITNAPASLSTTICSGEALNFIPNSSVGGTTYSWTSSIIGTVSGASVTGSGTGTITDILINTGNTPGTVTYTITPVFGGCSGTSVDYVVTVDPLPDATASDATICSGATSNVLISNPNGVTGTTFSWVVHSSTNVSGATGGSGSLIGQTLTGSDMINSGSVTYRITPTANGCSGSPFDVTVTVNPTPDITNTPASLSTTICSGVALNFLPGSNIIGTTYSWTSSIIGTVSGASVTGSGTGTITDIPINTGNTPGTVTYTITPAFGGCSSTPVDYVVTVDPLPDATASDATICSGATSNVLISNPNGVTGTTFSWVVHSSTNVSGATGGSGSLIGQTLTSSDMINSGSVTYRITPAANGCSGSPFDVTVTVNPTPDITNTSASLSTTICSGAALNFIPNASVGGTTYSWTSSTIGTISGASVTGSGTGAIMDTPINTGNSPGTVTYTITPTAGGCSGTQVDYVVTVDPLPDATASDATICSGATSNVLISNPNGVTGTTFSWVVHSSTNVSGATGGNGSLIGQKLTSSDMINSGSVTYRITPMANGCSGTPFDVIVTENPTPAINNTPLDLINTICSGTGLNFIPSSTVTGTTYSWTSSIIGTIDGASITASGSGAINDTPVNYGNNIASVIYQITPSHSGCAGTPVDYIVFVEPIPTVDASDQTICSGELSNVIVTNPNGVSGTSFDWVVSNITGAITGASNGSGALISQQLINTSAVSGSVTYTITPTASGCSGIPFNVVVTVDPLPTVSAGIDMAICEGENALLNGTTGGAATMATWTSSDGLGTFSPNNNTLNATFMPDASQIGSTITLTLTTNDPAGPCHAAESSISLTINALPVVSFGGLNPEYAVNEPTVPLFGSPSGGTFVGPGIVSGLSFSPFEAGVGTHAIQYNYTDPGTGCSHSSAPQSVKVNPLPDVGIPGLGATDFCFDDPDFPLVGDPVADGINTFGIFSGPGVVNNDLFTPSLAGVGTHVIRYTYTDENNATNFTDVVVNVRELPVADFGVFNSCDGEVVNFTDLSSVPNPSTIVRWEWDFGDNSPIDNAQNPSHLYSAPGIYTIVLTVESDFGCRSSKSADLEIGAFPTTKFSWEQICFGDAAMFTDNTFFPTGTISSYLWDFGDPVTGPDNTSGQQNPSHVFSAPGWYDVSLTVTTGIGCQRTVTEQVFILPAIGAGDYPYTESFENGSGGWVAQGINNSWEWGVPATDMVIDQAADGTNAWVTNLSGTYNSGEKSWVNSPCFDFSTIERPMISFKIWSHTEDQKSGAIVECSTDGGLTWTVLGDNRGLESVEWYNSSAILGSPSSPGNVNIGDLGWSGKETGWKKVKHSLDEFKGNSSVQFRITFGADLNDPSISGLNGFAFDDVYIGERSKVILLEHFTNNFQVESSQSNEQIANLVNQNGGEVFSINYHTSFPGFDLFNQENTADPSARRLFYGLSEPPNVVVNGAGIFKLLNASNTTVLQDSISNFSLETPFFDIDLTLPPASNSVLDISTIITATAALPPGFEEELVVHTAIIETEVSGIERLPPGVIYHNVMKKLLPDASGHTINRAWNVNDTEVIDESWVVEKAFDPTKLAVIVFVQNKDTKRVYQAAYIKAPDKQNATITGIGDHSQNTSGELKLYPQPASDHVILELEPTLQNDYVWKISDQRGVTIETGKIDRHRNRIDIPTIDLVSGMYFIILENKDTEIIRRKMVIVRQ